MSARRSGFSTAVRETSGARLLETMTPSLFTRVLLTGTLAACSTATVGGLVLTSAQRPMALEVTTTPVSWVPVAYGDAQVSVPPTWVVYAHAWCGGQPSAPILQLGVVVWDLACPVAPSLPTVRITPLGSIPAPYRQEQPVLLDGVPVILGPKLDTSITYFVPSLHVELWAIIGSGTRVIGTLAVAPRDGVLASGPAPAVPASWQSVTFAGLRFSFPQFWPVTRTSVAAYGLGTLCQAPGVAFPDNAASLLTSGVTLSTDQRLQAPPPCPIGPQAGTPQPPMDGVQVDSGKRVQFLVTLAFSTRCRDLDGLSACPATSPPYSILVLRVTVPGRSAPVLVSVGLAGNGLVARTILYSLRPS
ncbi:MAG: hypothetical protein ABSD97_13860 [Acidimicrobiales bacterium]